MAYAPSTTEGRHPLKHVREKTAWSLAAALGLLLALSLAGIVRGGPLEPPTGPQSTPNGIDGRIPIRSLPLTINTSGSYVVIRDLQYSSGTGITVNADNVTIDLNGFTLDGVSGAGNGVYAGGRANLTIKNGVLRRWAYGIYNDDAGADGGSFRDLQLADNAYGIALGRGGRLDASVVHSNALGAVSYFGGGTSITNSTFADNTTSIFLQSSNHLVESNHIGIAAGATGIYAGNFTTIRRNYFANPLLTGYVTIDLNTASYVVAIENRIKASLTVGGSGQGNYIPYDFMNALTNISP